jgi:hypothetical protein
MMVRETTHDGGLTAAAGTGSAEAVTAAAAAAAPPCRLRDHDLLRCATIFLVARTGQGPSGGVEPLDVELGQILGDDVEAYGLRGRREVLALLTLRGRTFPTSVLSVTVSALDGSVRVDYYDGSGETVWCGRSAKHEVIVEMVSTHREAVIGCAAAAAAVASAATQSGGGGPTGVQVLWWAVRFLHADIDRNYAAQRRCLADNAAAFGVVGREEILRANGETLPDEEKTVYTIPYPLTVDEDSGTVVLMFNAFSATGELKYRGTDLMVVDRSSGLVQRIVTVNHGSGVVYSPQSVL